MSRQSDHARSALSPTLTVGAVSSGLIESGGMVDVSPVWEFDAVYRREYPGLIAVAAALTGDRDGAQDLVQDTMVKAFIRWDRVCHLDRPGAS
jgi:Sigma-70 region 2